MDDAGDRDRVAFSQKARHLQTHDYVFAGNRFLNCRTNARVSRNSARRGAPRGQVVRQGETHRSFAVAAGDSFGLPECGVFELATDGWLSVRTLVLEISELIRRFVAREVCRLLTRIAGEGVVNRQTRLHFVVAPAI